ncbi:hypothetical protein CYLTODRAFT_314349, partial [Cylindrobasidium torrendii FP15055 ss-10]
SIANAFNEFTNAIISIFLGLFNSVLAVFQAIFALGKDIVGSLVHLVTSVVKLGVDVCQGATGFVFANFFTLAIIGGGYYLYTQNQQG